MRAHEGVRKQEIQWTSKKNKRKVFDNKNNEILKRDDG